MAKINVKKYLCICLVILVAGCVAVPRRSSTPELSGQVRNAEGVPLPDTLVALLFEKQTHVWGELSKDLEFATYTFTDDEGRFSLPSTQILSSSGKQLYGTWQKATPSVRFVNKSYQVRTVGVSDSHMDVLLSEGRQFHDEGLNIIHSLREVEATPVHDVDPASLGKLEDALH